MWLRGDRSRDPHREPVMAAPRIVVVGRDEDLCVRMMVDHLTASGARVMRLSENRLEARGDFSWDVVDDADGGSDRVTIDGVQVRHSEIDAVLNRSVGIEAPGPLSVEDRVYVAVEWQAAILAWTHRVPCRVVDRVRPELWFSPLLGALDLACLLPGVKIPLAEVTVTASPAGQEVALPDGPFIYAPVSQVGDYPIGDEAARRGLRALAAVLPISVRSAIPAEGVRVVVVGETVHFVPTGLRLDPGPRVALAEACLSVAGSLDLAFCEVAFARDDRAEGGWSCHLANRLPLLETLPQEIRQGVVVSLGSLLMRRDSGASRQPA